MIFGAKREGKVLGHAMEDFLLVFIRVWIMLPLEKRGQVLHSLTLLCHSLMGKQHALLWCFGCQLKVFEDVGSIY